MKKYLIALCMIPALTSCKKFIDVNTDPNYPTDVPPKLLLSTTTVGLAYTNGNELGRAAGILVQYNAGVNGNPSEYDLYNMDGKLDNQWNSEIYNGSVNNLRLLISKTQETSPAYAGIAKIQLAYILSLATDLWGDVPYSQAGFGLQYPTPRFDKQEDIYLGNTALGIQSLFNLVREGIADLDKTSALKPTTDDITYYVSSEPAGNNITKWKRAANTLLMKMALQISNVARDTAVKVMNEVIAGNNFINDNALDWQVSFSSAAPSNQNPYYLYDIANRPDEEMLSARFITRMKALNDTIRLAKYYTKSGGNFIGYDNGANTTAPVSATRSRYTTYVVGTKGDAPIRILTNFQRAFIMAEAALVLGTPGDANALFQDGIKASMTKAGMTATEITAYFTTNPTVVTLAGSNADKLKQIITQKYISLVGNGIEAYNDFRRTGYPELALSQRAAGDDPNTIPKRYPYISTEGSRNPNQPNPRIRTNVKVWWGK